jgi:hypothetical protein
VVSLLGIFYLFFTILQKINDALKIDQNYTIAALPQGGREPNVVWYGVW